MSFQGGGGGRGLPNWVILVIAVVVIIGIVMVGCEHTP